MVIASLDSNGRDKLVGHVTSPLPQEKQSDRNPSNLSHLNTHQRARCFPPFAKSIRAVSRERSTNVLGLDVLRKSRICSPSFERKWNKSNLSSLPSSHSPRNLSHVFTISLVAEYLILLSKLIPARCVCRCYLKVRIAARVGARMVLVARWNTSRIRRREARWKLPSRVFSRELSLTIRILLRGRGRVVAS